MIKSGIYKITNLTNQMFYIGSSQNLIKRWRDHRSVLNVNTHKNIYLQNAWNKYGKVNFEFEILEIVALEFLIEREQHWIDHTKCYNRTIGYNLSPTAGNCAGFIHTQETRLKLSALRKGKPRTEEAKAAIKEGWKKRKERGSVSEETRAKMRAAQLGSKKSEMTKEKHRQRMLGNQFNTGRVQSDEHKGAISAGQIARYKKQA